MAPTVIAIGFTQIIGWGATFNLPGVIGTSIADSFDSSLDRILLGPTVMLTILALVSWWVAPLFERFGARNLMIVGAIVMSVGLISMTQAPSIPSYIAAWILLGIGGATSLSTAAQIALAEVFGDRAREAIGAMSLVSGLANTILWPITSRIDDALGWRTTTAIFAIAVVLIYVPLVTWAISGRVHVDKRLPGKEEPEGDRLDPIRFALVAASTALNGFITWGFSLTLIPLLMEKGLSNSQAVTLASSLGVIQIAARMFDVFGGWYPLKSATISTVTMLFSFVLLYLGSSLAMAATFIMLYGLSGGLLSIVRATLPLTMFPSRAYARAAARLALPLNLSFAAAPPVFANILASQGTDAALVVTIVLSGTSMVALVILSRFVRQQDLPRPTSG